MLVDKFADNAKSFSLKINVKKTECFYQRVILVMPSPSLSTVMVHDESLVQCRNFVFLGQGARLVLQLSCSIFTVSFDFSACTVACTLFSTRPSHEPNYKSRNRAPPEPPVDIYIKT